MEPLNLGAVRVDLDRRWVERDGGRERLTTLEAELLRYLARAGRPVGRDELLANVWKYTADVVSRACDTTVRRLRTKIEVDPSRPEVLLTVHGSGYCLVREPPPREPSPAPPAERVGGRRHPLGDRTLDLDRQRVEGPGGAHPLTATEFALLDALVAAGGAAVDRSILQRRVWGTTFGRPLGHTVGRLRRKLEADPSRPRFLLTTANGYRLELGRPPPEPGPVALPPLPVEVDRLFGRDADVARVAAHLAAGDRLVTLTGPGGVGKTRLALAVARVLPDGATWVDATEARTHEALYTRIALALRARLTSGDPQGDLGRVLEAEPRRVLVLDNVEQIPSASVALGGLLARAPRLRILATSRVLLRARGERRVDVEPLRADAAVDLFVDRAVRPPDPSERDEVLALVEALDGLPLAVELAAARTGVLRIAAIRARTGDRLRLLATADEGRPARHRSLRASLDGSWELLEPWSRAALARLTVFEGGFTVDAAERILDLSAWPAAAWTLDVLQELVDASLLQVDADGRRFRMLSVVRDHAAGHLPAEERAATELRHGRTFARPVEDLEGPREVEARAALAAELPNLSAALERAILRGDAEVAVGALEAVFEIWWLTGPYGTAVGEVERVLGLALGPGLRARAELIAGKLRTALGDLPSAEQHLHTATALAREVGPSRVEAEARLALAALYHRGSQFDDALREAEASCELARRNGTWSIACRSLATIGAVHQQRFALDRADEHLQLAHRIALDHGAVRLGAGVLRRLGGTALMRGQVEQGRARFEQALSAATDSGDLLTQAWLLLDLAQVHRQSGRTDLAQSHTERAADSLVRIGDRLGEGMAYHALARDLLHRGALDGVDALLDRALRALRACGSKLNECLVLNSLGGLAFERAEIDRAARWYREALALALAMRDPGREALVRSNLGAVACLQGAWAEGLAELGASVAGYRALGNRAGLGGALARLADGLADLDRLDEAELHARETLAIGEAEDEALVGRAATTLAIVAARRGELSAAEGWLARVSEAGAEASRLQQAARLHATAELAAARGETGAARAAVEAASALVEPVGLGARFRVLRAALTSGQPP